MDGRNRFKRKSQYRRRLGALDLEGKVSEAGGRSGSALEVLEGSGSLGGLRPSGGLYGRRASGDTASFQRTRLFRSPRGRSNNGSSTPASRSVKSNVSRTSRLSRFSRASSQSSVRHGMGHGSGMTAVHVVCAVSENLARETCVASLDAGSPTSLQVTKQGNGQTYAETLAYLEILKPDEVLLNEGRRNSQLARKIMELYNVSCAAMELPLEGRRRAGKRNRMIRPGNDDDGDGDDVDNYEDGDETAPLDEGRYGPMGSSTVVKFISRSCFDQTKGADLLRRIAREATYDTTVVEEYILLSSAHAVLHYTQHCLGATFSRNCLSLSVNSGGNNLMAIDRATMYQLELLVNSKTGKDRGSLIGTIDHTKTTVGSRLLRTNLMSPPKRVDTIHARLELVDLFLGNEDFFYTVLEHITNLPDVNTMLSSIALIPRKSPIKDGERKNNKLDERIASKGIAALVSIKTTLQALPSFAGVLKNQLEALESQQDARTNVNDEGASIVTDRTSILVGLGSGDSVVLQRHHLLRAIISIMTQPAFTAVLEAVSDVFTETTTFSRNANSMRHQECFALKSPEDGMMSILRKAFLGNVDDIYRKADEYAEVYGIQVSVRYSNGRGYYLALPSELETEIPSVFLLPAKSGRFINCTTAEITALNTRASDNVRDLLLMTHDRIQEVLDVARTHYDAIAALSDAVALLDMCHSFADNVTLNPLPWCRPVVSEKSTAMRFSGGVNPSDDASALSSNGSAMMIRNGRFGIDIADLGASILADGPSAPIPNDTFAADGKNFTVITGINGSGKSTYLKQIAIIVILAHCGSYVPAEAASIPVRDRLCCRIGNADDQEHNISTFMLEMKETAFICNNATDRSLVLVDELGRATSNEDGVAIAWSTCEYLLKKRAMTFFVTHYPQLARLGEIYPTVTVVHMEASVAGDNAGDISYTHKVKPGACSVSTAYGVELAAACGWQREILENARGYQREVEASLPDDQLCRPPSLEDDPDFQTRAYASLEAICRDLSGVIADENVHSYASVKSDLSRRRGRHLGNDGTEFIDTIDKLLFRYSRTKRWNRRRPMAETEPVSPLPSTTAEGFLPPQEALLPGNFDEKSPGSGRFASEANHAEAAGTDSELSDETSSLSSSESSDNSSTSSASDRSG